MNKAIHNLKFSLHLKIFLFFVWQYLHVKIENGILKDIEKKGQIRVGPQPILGPDSISPYSLSSPLCLPLSTKHAIISTTPTYSTPQHGIIHTQFVFPSL